MNRIKLLLAAGAVLISFVSVAIRPVNAAIFEPTKDVVENYGICIKEPGNDECTCPDNAPEGSCIDGYINCGHVKWREDEKCRTTAREGIKEIETALAGSGITGTRSFGDLVIRLVNFIIPFLALAAFVGFVYAGFLYVTAYGNEEQLQKSKKILIYAAIGLLVVIVSASVVRLLTTELVKQLQ